MSSPIPYAENSDARIVGRAPDDELVTGGLGEQPAVGTELGTALSHRPPKVFLWHRQFGDELTGRDVPQADRVHGHICLCHHQRAVRAEGDVIHGVIMRQLHDLLSGLYIPEACSEETDLHVIGRAVFFFFFLLSSFSGCQESSIRTDGDLVDGSVNRKNRNWFSREGSRLCIVQFELRFLALRTAQPRNSHPLTVRAELKPLPV